jgi:hypothetical protein
VFFFVTERELRHEKLGNKFLLMFPLSLECVLLLWNTTALSGRRGLCVFQVLTKEGKWESEFWGLYDLEY